MLVEVVVSVRAVSDWILVADWIGRRVLLARHLLHPQLLGGRVPVQLAPLLHVLMLTGVECLMLHQRMVADVEWRNWFLSRLVL